MAKDKGKRSSGVTAASPDGGVPVNASKSGADTTPKLEDNAFAGLRQKIEQKLKDESAGKQKPKNKGKNTSNDSGKEKDTPNKSGKKDQIPSPKPAPKHESNKNKGQKRDRNGDVIAREETSAGKEKKSKPSNGNDDDALRQEILALGGAQEDFDMLAGVGSDSEVEDSRKPNKKSDDDSLRKELSSMLASAGQVAPEDLKEAEEPEDSDEDENGDDEAAVVQDEDISDVEEDTPLPPAKPAKEPAKKEKAKESPAEEPEDILPKEYSKLTVPPRADWYSIPLPSIPSSTQAKSLPRHVVDRVYEYAVSLLEKDSKKYSEAQQASSSSSHKFYSTIMSSGTLSDKISALTLAVQESPLHSTKALENLITLGKKRSRTQAVEVLRSLKDMFAQGTLLPSNRRLRSFANQPALIAAFQGAGNKWSEGSPLPNGLQESNLIVWAFEHYLKEQYFEVLKILEVWCNDEIEFSRSRAVSYVYELLKERPEQEANLLRLLVNKLGDPGKKIASRASYLLLQLEQAHPMMKPTIIKGVEEVVFRPGQSQHAKYYAIITLNQTVLSGKEEKVAVQLLDIYFSLFVTLLKPVKDVKPQGPKGHGKFGRKGGKGQGKDDHAKGQAQVEEMQDKLTSGVLTGVNRAYPFTASDTERLSKHIDTLFRITHSSNFNTSIQALMLIQQLTSSHQVSADRFYRTLYESLLDRRVATSSKQTLYLNLLYKALKNDLNVRRVKAFVKRIVQVLGLHQPSFICGIFYLIRELEKTFTGIQSLFDQPEDNDSDDEEVFRDVPDEDDGQENEVSESKPQKPTNGYDPRKRDPEHSNADKTCLWELLPYMSHYHPAVSVNASYLMEHQPMSGKPDLSLHTLIHFLDRFIYRAPKASTSARGASIMQPLAGSDASDRLVSAGKDRQYVPLNSEEFWKKKSDEIAAEDVVFHEYFNRLGKDKERAHKEKKKSKDPLDRDEEGGDGLSDDESEIWQALVNSRPEVEGDGDSDDDLDMDDLDSAYDEDEEEKGDEAEEDESDGGVIFNDESDEDMDEPQAEAQPVKAQAKKAQDDKEASDGEDNFDMDVSDEDAFVDSDEDVPMAFEEEADKDDGQAERKKKRKLKHLPTFASADDYAALLAGEEEGM